MGLSFVVRGQVEPAMKGHAFAIESKIDGERMLCHKAGDEVREKTRRLTSAIQQPS